MSLRQEILNDLVAIEEDLGEPTFTWNNNSYNLIPSITDFRRDLDTGGFQLARLMTATIRAYYVDEFDIIQPLFGNGLPQPQNIITYNLDGSRYRIESLKIDPTNSYFRLIAHSTSKGL